MLGLQLGELNFHSTQMSEATAARGSVFQGAVLRWMAVIAIASLAACAVVRAPTLIKEFTIPLIGLTLDFNAGYLLSWGSITIAIAIGLLLLSYPRPAPIRRDAIPMAALLFGIVVLASAYLGLQFFLLLAPPGECNNFERLRYLTDASLQEFKPEYCMSLPAELQARMPWLIRPPMLQAWGQIVSVAGCAAFSWLLWKRVRPRKPV